MLGVLSPTRPLTPVLQTRGRYRPIYVLAIMKGNAAVTVQACFEAQLYSKGASVNPDVGGVAVGMAS